MPDFNLKRIFRQHSHTFIFSAVLVLWIITLVIVLWIGSDWGKIEVFYLTSGFFFALTLAALIVIFIQQKKELALLRREITGGKEALEFEQTKNKFLIWLKLYTDLVNGNQLSRDGQIFKGRERFVVIFNELVKHYKEISADQPQESLQSIIDASMERLSTSIPTDLFVYYQTAEKLLRFIEPQSDDLREYFSELYRSQLSQAELLLLFYYALSSKGKLTLKPLLKELKILKNLPARVVDEAHLALYRQKEE